MSAKGSDAETAYRADVVASRVRRGRGSFDAARAAWAAPLGLEPDDGAYLCEIRGGPMRLEDLVEALDGCGKTRDDALSALDRLFDAGLLAATPGA